MMPIIRPLHTPEAPLTEYEKEQIAFAEMQAELHPRKGTTGSWASFSISLKGRVHSILHLYFDPCLERLLPKRR